MCELAGATAFTLLAKGIAMLETTQRRGCAVLVAWWCCVGGVALAADSLDPANPGTVKIGSLVVGDYRFEDFSVRFGGLVSVGNGSATRTYDRLDLTKSPPQLTIASINVQGQTYTDVVISVTEITRPPSASGPVTDLVPNDPLFVDQWHLKNTGQVGRDGVAGKPGEDLRVGRAWNYATGTGIQIAVVDDGLDVFHEDLQVVPGKSWDYRTNAYGDPSSTNSSHGTSCAGLAAAKGNNGLGVTGVAFHARVVGYNLLSATTGEYGADAVTKDLASNHIYSNSYGATDGNGLIALSDAAWRAAIDTGTSLGRNGKGVIYTWAAGNGHAGNDRSDYDGQANYQGVLAIGALNDQGLRSSYSEMGSNVLVAAFGGEFCATHTTTTADVSGGPGYNDGATKPDDYAGQANYTRCMNGTSAATPEASGVVALLLEANPELGWRDVRAILAGTARKNDPSHPDWVTNGAGLKVNHSYGFGAIDASAAVQAALVWNNIPAQKTFTANALLATTLPIEDHGSAVTSSIRVAGSGISNLEFVDVNFFTDHTEVGDLEITLTSPAGTPSTLAVTHSCVNPSNSEAVACGAAMAQGVRFGVVRVLGEPADGTWTLAVRDGKTGATGAVTGWDLKAYGY
ncbi:MAG: serine protease [Burkholderiales bacterium PBB4]|nr:MAG: serine protease [Burkholderiales bacterium PBB4]